MSIASENSSSVGTVVITNEVSDGVIFITVRILSSSVSQLLPLEPWRNSLQTSRQMAQIGLTLL